MTQSQKNWWKNNLFNVSTLIAMLAFIVVQARWQETVDIHMVNKDIHMTFEKKSATFVPRVELDVRLKNIEDSLTRIEKKLPNN